MFTPPRENGEFLIQQIETPQQTRRDRLRGRVLDAAEAAICERGLAGLKARELAQAAGCALGAIYTVFEDLDELILRVNARTLARLEAALAAPRHDGNELKRLALVYLSFARNEEPRWRALFEHRLPPQKPLPQWYAKERDRLFDLLEAPLARLLPKEPPEKLRLRARTLFSAVHGIVLLGLDEKLAETASRTLDAELSAFIDTIDAGLSAAAACQASPALK